jgi:hypothetical protein
VSSPSQWEACDKELTLLRGNTIPKKTGEFRPIINLKGLNQFLLYRNLRMEDIQTLRHIVKKRDWLAKIDVKDVYLTIPLILGSESFVFQVGREIFFILSVCSLVLLPPSVPLRNYSALL